MQIKILPVKSKSKYKNVPCICNGIKFPSLKEAKRYVSLYYRQKAGEIFKLKLQVNFPILVKGVKVCTYKADFVYFNKAGQRIVEDAKGMKTPVYKLKKKLLFQTDGIEIIEV